MISGHTPLPPQCSGEAFKKCHYLTEVLRPYFLRPKDSTINTPNKTPFSKTIQEFPTMPETERAYSRDTLRTASSHTGGRAAQENRSATTSVYVTDPLGASDCDPGPSLGGRCWKRNVNAISRAFLLPFSKQKCTVSPTPRPSTQYLSTAVPLQNA